MGSKNRQSNWGCVKRPFEMGDISSLGAYTPVRLRFVIFTSQSDICTLETQHHHAWHRLQKMVRFECGLRQPVEWNIH